MERVLTALAALLAFVFTAIFLYFAVDFTIRIIEDPDGWQRLFLIPFTCLFAAYGSGYLGYRYWQRSKNTHCAAWGCDNPTASLGDNLCAECLKKREQGGAASNDTAAPTPPTPEVQTPESSASVAAEEVVKATKPSLKCVSPDCQSPRTEYKKGGFFLWWCHKCWEKRDDKVANTNEMPPCITKGCEQPVADKFKPWCREHWESEGIYEDHPVKTQNGEWVDSRSEKRIADFLHRNNIHYEYAKPLPDTSDWTCDFFLPAQDGGGEVYIEYFGLVNHRTKGAKYRDKVKRKWKYYNSKGKVLISLFPKHNSQLEKHLGDELRNKHGYNITTD